MCLAVTVKSAEVQSRHKQDSNGVYLDTEVSDVLFHFDTVVTELEKSTLTPRSLTPNDPQMRTPTPNQGQMRELTTPDILLLQATGANLKETESDDQTLAGVARESVPKSVQPKFRVQDIKQQFLQSAQRDTAPQMGTHTPETTQSGGEKVRNIIAQIQASSRESSPSPAPVSERGESPVKQVRPRSSSISQRISMLTQFSTENEVFERKEQPVMPSRKISEITHDFELKKSPENESRPHSSPSRRKRRTSSSSKDDSLIILSPPRSSSQVARRGVKAQVNGLQAEMDKVTDTSSGEAERIEKYTSRLIDEALSELETSASIGETPSMAVSSEDTSVPQDEVEPSTQQSPSPLHSEPVTSEAESSTTISMPVEQVADDVTVTSPLSPSVTIQESPEDSTGLTRQCTSQTSLTSPGSGEGVFRHESTSSSEVLLTPTLEPQYRLRSISDVSHNTRMLTSYRTESSVSTSSLDRDPDSVSNINTHP